MDFRYHIDPDTDLPHIHGHGVTEAEAEFVLRHPGEERAGRDGSRHALGQTPAGRHLHVIYVPDEEGDGVFVITAYDIRGKPLQAYKEEEATMSESRFPAGWDAQRVKQLIDYYEGLSEDEQVAEDEAAFAAEREGQTVIAVPDELLPEIRRLLAAYRARSAEQVIETDSPAAGR